LLTELHIKDVGLIASLSLSFSQGFNILTGETGAGKTTIIRSLMFLSGRKTASSLIRQGSSCAQVSGYFLLATSEALIQRLNSLAISHHNKRNKVSLLVRRVLYKNGRTKAWINDTPIMLATLKSILSSYLEIIAQHEQQQLFCESLHVGYLDEFVNSSAVLSSYKEVFASTCNDLQKIRTYLSLYENLKNQKDYLEFRVKELRDLDPSIEDFENISLAHDRQQKGLDLRESLFEVKASIDLSALHESLIDKLNLCRKNVLSLGKKDSSFADYDSLLDNSINALSQLSFDVESCLSKVDIDAQSQDQLASRLSIYKKLFRKFSVSSVGELKSLLEDLEAQLADVVNIKSNLTTLVAGFGDSVLRLQEYSQKLYLYRKNRTKALVDGIKKELLALDMKDSELRVNFDPCPERTKDIDLLAQLSCVLSQEVVDLFVDSYNIFLAHNSGGDKKITFSFKSSGGASFYPLSKVVSGGEVSRIMLAFKKVLVSHNDMSTMVFDEIDAGISGRVADVVGRKLYEVASRFQLICISHLAQVAVYANNHIYIKKSLTKDKTSISAHTLEKEQCIREVAKMISGAKLTSTSLTHASNLYKKSKRYAFVEEVN
jgi:DNA repair protein RecN (Recombination protein N)